ncbi:MAG TPA: hypothetical protein VE262_09145 [Blastocatellia bacterium]|nr:hypothetical protein [Blastocatellia bacterium]
MVKIEDQSSEKLRNLNENVQSVLSVIPAEHTRGLYKIVFVDLITEPRISASQRANLPALYHPRMGGQSAWAEVATTVLSPKKKFPQNLLTKMALKSNLAQVILSLVAQHYHLTLSKGIKKNQIELACRSYVEKYFEKWRENQGGLRVKLMKPFKPYLDKLAKKLAKRYREEMERKRLQAK